MIRPAKKERGTENAYCYKYIVRTLGQRRWTLHCRPLAAPSQCPRVAFSLSNTWLHWDPACSLKLNPVLLTHLKMVRWVVPCVKVTDQQLYRLQFAVLQAQIFSPEAAAMRAPPQCSARTPSPATGQGDGLPAMPPSAMDLRKGWSRGSVLTTSDTDTCPTGPGQGREIISEHSRKRASAFGHCQSSSDRDPHPRGKQGSLSPHQSSKMSGSPSPALW